MASSSYENGAISSKLFHPLHSSNVLKLLNETRKDKNLCDGSVLISGEEIPVQKGMLAACSPYFRAVFAYEQPGSSKEQNGTVILDDISAETFSHILDYMYTSEIELNDDNIQDVLQAADLLLLTDLKSLCCEYLEQCLSPNNCLGIIDFSEQYSCPRVLHKAQEYFNDHFCNVIEYEEFKLLPASRLFSLLQENSLKTSENAILNAIIHWVLYDAKNRSEKLKDLIESCVRIHQIEPLFLRLPKKLDGIDPSELYAVLENLRCEQQNQNQNSNSPRGYCYALVSAGGEGPCDPNDDCEYGAMEAISNVRFVIPHNGPNVRSEQWYDLPNMSCPRIGHGLIEAGGCLYAVGGRDKNGHILNTGEKFNPQTNKWTPIASMSHGRVGFGLVTIDDKIYALGGSNNMSDPLRSVEKYCIYTNKWQSLPNMYLKRACAAYSVVNKKIYVIGGGVMGQIYESVECFDTRYETWMAVAPMKERRFDSRATSVEDDVYVFGGLRRLECPSAHHSGIGMKFCGTEVYSTELQQWTTMMQGSSGMCCMNESSHVDSALYLPTTNQIFVIGDLDIGGVYHHVRAFNKDLRTWRGVIVNKPHRQRNGSYGFFKLSNSYNRKVMEAFHSKNK